LHGKHDLNCSDILEQPGSRRYQPTAKHDEN
jgi:hypothetical protein